MPDLGGPQGQGGRAPDHVARLALVTSEALPALDPDSQLLPPALRAIGVEPEIVAWSDDGVDWAAYDAVVVRSVWDYFDHPEAFARWLDRVERQARQVLNPVPVIRWNAHKSYLRDLEQRGVRTLETVWVDAGSSAEVPFAEAVVKPAVDGGAKGLRRAARGERVEADVDTLVQPLVASIATEGEVSLLFAGGELSHVVRKVPKPGDIRSQPTHGSDVRREEPSPEALEAARRVLTAVGEQLPYARIDLVRDAHGELCLIELEVIEPQLYLEWDPQAAGRFARAIAAAVRRPT